MKRVFPILLIALLLLVPVLSMHAEDGRYVYADDDILTEAELQTVNARAAEIASTRGVGVYYFFYSAVEDLPSYIREFAEEHVVEENALVLGFNENYYYFLQIGPVAKAALPDSVCDGAILDAYRAVKGDPERKLLAYLNAADDALAAYFETQSGLIPSGTSDLSGVPANIALTDGGKPTVVDREHLLTDREAEALSQRLKEIGSEYRCDVVVVTVPRLDGKSAEAYADDFFDYNGYGYGAVPNAQGTTIDGDGILLLLSMEGRDFAISTSGSAIKAFTDYGIQVYLEPQFLPYLSNNNFSDGFDAFADGCEYLLKTAREGVPYDHRRIYSEALSDAQLLIFNDRAESVANASGIGIYLLENAAADDPDAFLSDFIRERLLESNAIVLVNTPSGCALRVTGSLAQAKFTDAKLDSVREAVEPHLNRDAYSAVAAYLDVCEKIATDYAHILTNDGALPEATLRSVNDRLKQLYLEHGIAMYFLCDDTSDPSALARTFLDSGKVYEGNAVVFGTNGSACSVLVRGDLAREKFSEKRIAKLVKEVGPYLSAQDLSGALDAFAARGEKIMNWRPVNWITLFVAVVAGLLFGFIPVSGMKRQLISVNKKTSAETYMEPASFTVTQNSDLLLGKNVTRSVHVVHTESSGGGGRGGSGGSSFHGGSSTHTSSSGGTHGGHSGKF